MGTIVGGPVGEPPPPVTLRRFQHFSGDQDPVTVQLGNGMQQMRPQRGSSPPAQPFPSVYEIDATSVVESLPATPAGSKFTNSFERVSESEVLAVSAPSAGDLPHGTAAYGIAQSMAQTEYTASGLGSREVSAISLSSSSASIKFDAPHLVEPRPAVRSQAVPETSSVRIAGIRARGHDGMGAALPRAPMPPASAGAATCERPTLVYKEGYTGHQPTARTPSTANAMQTSSPALAAMWNERTSLGESNLYAAAANRRVAAGAPPQSAPAKLDGKLLTSGAAAAHEGGAQRRCSAARMSVM